ncbi:MAG: hypothetical protein IPI52_01430 [Bacteroidetes bacterium]|jgi:hypothetical protein|nr:hypothetical protein [Bacteroidota bacterium]
MGTTALIMMISAEGIIVLFTAYFFWKVLVTPPKKEPDSYSDNDLVI